jgi:transglutaminase/protease-like cytokinesis protein 3
MRLSLCSCLMIFRMIAGAQDGYTQIDQRALKIKSFNSLVDLSQKLVLGNRTEFEKSRALFFWITQYIAYDYKELRADTFQSYYTAIKKYLDTAALTNYDSAYNKLILDTVISRKAGLCDGYARLFKTLGDLAGLKVEIVQGMAKKSEHLSTTLYHSNHAWNTVQVNGKWQLLDACWGRGFRDSGEVRTKNRIENFYFLTDPKKFSYTHYPQDKKYLYYSNPISQSQFMTMPLVFPAFFEHGFESFTPLSGVILNPKNDRFTYTLSRPNSPDDRTFDGQDVLLKKSEIRYQLEQKIDSVSEFVFVYYKNTGILQYKLQRTK